MSGFDQQTLWSAMDGHPTQAPLADRMRPRTLDEFIGQQKLVGEGRLLRRAIMADRLQSSIFWGPPGCGKTTLAGIVANMTGSAFEKLNAVTSGVADVRKVLKEAEERRVRYGKATYLLLDECHRWSKAQSDSILPAIESGLIRFIGSTTENPMASMTPAIVSRCRLFAFESLTVAEVETALEHALTDRERGYGRYTVVCEDGALRYIARVADGDVRVALSALELAFLTTPETTDENHPEPYRFISLAAAQESVQKPVLKLDEDLYYDMLSAFIKSMRGSDANAALLWFARLLYAGVDPKLIVRRIIVHASEDVGLADPAAMLQAHAAAKALEVVGMPEARIPIAQAIIAICTAEKSNSVVNALDAAMADAEKGGFSAVPEYLRDQSYATPHKNTPQYKYPHDYPEHYVKQTYLPEGYEDRVYYRPGELGGEQKIRARMERRFGGTIEREPKTEPRD
ncbi:MAG: replication-associated recombination protein A [Eubacteriales bacterium]|nr:replication-associated recombination protein A [Eubacteriales bacterium]